MSKLCLGLCVFVDKQPAIVRTSNNAAMSQPPGLPPAAPPVPSSGASLSTADGAAPPSLPAPSKATCAGGGRGSADAAATGSGDDATDGRRNTVHAALAAVVAVSRSVARERHRRERMPRHHRLINALHELQHVLSMRGEDGGASDVRTHVRSFPRLPEVVAAIAEALAVAAAAECPTVGADSTVPQRDVACCAPLFAALSCLLSTDPPCVLTHACLASVASSCFQVCCGLGGGWCVRGGV